MSERSRAYPGIDLETAEGILCRQLSEVGGETLERSDLASKLGYSSGKGGTAARKIAALVHYGLLDRSSDRFCLSPLGLKLLACLPGSPERQSFLRSALERPVLFRSILDRYRPEGRIPSSLAQMLSTDFGITARVMTDAADIFFRSARFVGILANDGRFLETVLPRVIGEQEPSKAEPLTPEITRKRLELLLSDRKSAWLEIPTEMSRKDLGILAQALEVQLAQLSIYLGLEEGAEIRPFRKRPNALRLTTPDDPVEK